MTNEEILANAPGWATMVCMERFWQKLTANSWRSIRLDLTYESLRIMPSANSGGIRSLSDIRRIVELEKEVERLNAHSLIFDAAPALNDDLKQKLETSERYLAATRDLLLMFAQSIDEAHRIAESSSNKESILSAFDGTKYKARERLNKFAIEQQIKALEETLRENSRSIVYPHGDNTDVIYTDDIKFDMEQLRQQLNGGE